MELLSVHCTNKQIAFNILHRAINYRVMGAKQMHVTHCLIEISFKIVMGGNCRATDNF